MTKRAYKVKIACNWIAAPSYVAVANEPGTACKIAMKAHLARVAKESADSRMEYDSKGDRVVSVKEIEGRLA